MTEVLINNDEELERAKRTLINNQKIIGSDIFDEKQKKYYKDLALAVMNYQNRLKL